MVGPVEAQEGSELLIFYDEDCSLCRNLAAYLAKSPALKLQPTSYDAEDGQTRHQELQVRFHGQLFEGEQAWEVILQEVPLARNLTWLAVRILGLKPSAKLIGGMASYARKLCRSCPDAPLVGIRASKKK